MTSEVVRRRWQPVDGVLLLDKPTGMTSNAALQTVRRLYSAAKAGHTGTLDPLATGLLPLCFGEATKFSSDLLDADKVYEADVLFGVTTTTADAEGEVLERRPVEFAQSELIATMQGFLGRILQVPPMYSALKRDGKPLYELARQGIEVERAAREVEIKALELLAFGGETCRLKVACSKGTYIRTLVEDIGAALGCGAHLTGLRRTEVGRLQITQAIRLDALVNMDESQRAAVLRAPDCLLSELTAVHLDYAEAERFAHGNPAKAGVPALEGKVRVYGADDRLLGLGLVDGEGRVYPKRLVSQ